MAVGTNGRKYDTTWSFKGTPMSAPSDQRPQSAEAEGGAARTDRYRQ
jgi:hypothetical protein